MSAFNWKSSATFTKTPICYNRRVSQPFVKIVERPPTAAKIEKQTIFGIARGITQTAGEAQKAVIQATSSVFNVRGSWLKEGGRFGIHKKTANMKDLTAEINTRADWLVKQKEGGTIAASKNVRTFHYTFEGKRYIAVPSYALRPKGSKKVIARAQWPSTLRRKKSTYVVKFKKNDNLGVFSRYGPGKGQSELMYILKPDVQIEPKDSFQEPIEKVLKRRLHTNIEASITKALRDIK